MRTLLLVIYLLMTASGVGIYATADGGTSGKWWGAALAVLGAIGTIVAANQIMRERRKG